MSQALNQNALNDWIKEKAATKLRTSGGTITDSDVKDVFDYIYSQGYEISAESLGAGVDKDSIYSQFTDDGYMNDVSQMKSDVFNTMSLTNDVASHLQTLEARVTALEKKMNTYSVGGSENWYDGGSDGTDNNWNVDEWYKTTTEQKSMGQETIEIPKQNYTGGGDWVDVWNSENLPHTTFSTMKVVISGNLRNAKNGDFVDFILVTPSGTYGIKRTEYTKESSISIFPFVAQKFFVAQQLPSSAMENAYVKIQSNSSYCDYQGSIELKYY